MDCTLQEWVNPILPGCVDHCGEGKCDTRDGCRECEDSYWKTTEGNCRGKCLSEYSCVNAVPRDILNDGVLFIDEVQFLRNIYLSILS